MEELSISKILRPGRLLRGLKARGLKGSAFHALRRVGTFAERALVGPDFIRITPMGWVCNHACPMCHLQHTAPDRLKALKKQDVQDGMRLEEYRRLFNGMPPGLEEVNIVGGGEPL